VATWAIGDLQGCWRSFEALLAAIGFDDAVDRLWLVGDLVNRGPDSLSVLRWCVAHDHALVAVLGNHDLHLLAAAAELRGPKPRDTLDAVLKAPDRPELLDWLRRRPLLHRTADHVLVHAGLPPWWTLDEAEGHARRLEHRLRQGPSDLLVPPKGHKPLGWDPASPDADKVALAGFVAMRCLDQKDRLVRSFHGAPEDRESTWRPWFEGRPSSPIVVFGHWAMLGHRCGPGWLATDSGCCWGGPMTAVCLDDDRVVQVPNQERAQR
jgi:bis(5'-nucleosyl)-tetraphosphatase (symmetrical)